MGNKPAKNKKKNTYLPPPSSSSVQPSPSSSSHPPSHSSDTNDREERQSGNYSNSGVLSPVSKSDNSKSLPSSSSKPENPSMKKLEEMFDKYKEADGQQIGPEGVELLCKDLGVEPEDIVVLVFAWHLNAQTMGYFRKDEFINGLRKLEVDSVARLKGILGNFRKDLDDPAKYKEIYKYAFTFAKERDQKILDLATADALLALVMGNRFPHSDNLRQFLKEQTTYKSVNMDQWMNILEFSRTIKADFSNYDENGAWPVLLDEYCGWSKEKLNS